MEYRVGLNKEYCNFQRNMGNEAPTRHNILQGQKTRAHLFMPAEVAKPVQGVTVTQTESMSSAGKVRRLSLSASHNGRKQHSKSKVKARQYLSLSKQESKSSLVPTIPHQRSIRPKVMQTATKQSPINSRKPSIERRVVKQQWQQPQRSPSIIRPRDLPREPPIKQWHSQQQTHPTKTAYAQPMPYPQVERVAHRAHQSMQLPPQIVVSAPSKENQAQTQPLISPRVESNKAIAYLTPATMLNQGGSQNGLKRVALSRSYMQESPVKGYSFDKSEEQIPSKGSFRLETQQSSKDIVVREEEKITDIVQKETDGALFTDPKLMAYITAPTKTSLFSSSDGKFALAFAKNDDITNKPEVERKATEGMGFLEEMGGAEAVSETLIDEGHFRFPTLTNFSSSSNNTSFLPVPRGKPKTASAKVIESCRPCIDPGVMADLLKISP